MKRSEANEIFRSIPVDGEGELVLPGINVWLTHDSGDGVECKLCFVMAIFVDAMVLVVCKHTPVMIHASHLHRTRQLAVDERGPA